MEMLFYSEQQGQWGREWQESKEEQKRQQLLCGTSGSIITQLQGALTSDRSTE